MKKILVVLFLVFYVAAVGKTTRVGVYSSNSGIVIEGNAILGEDNGKLIIKNGCKIYTEDQFSKITEITGSLEATNINCISEFSLPKLESVKNIYIANTSFVEINLGSLVNFVDSCGSEKDIEFIKIIKNYNLEEINLKSLKNIRNLHLSYNKSLEEINLMSLEKVNCDSGIEENCSLEEINLKSLETLGYLTISPYPDEVNLKSLN